MGRWGPEPVSIGSRTGLQWNWFRDRNRNRRVRKRNREKGRNLTEPERNYSPGRDQDCSGTGPMAGIEIVEYGHGTGTEKKAGI
uniref:Uncharacterized protein n=1 Tax=Acrobeloides nanus TaxID=290746 RepID=A0A914DDK6_9BILA